MNPRFLTIKAFCDRYGIRKSKAYELIKAGQVVAKKFGGRTVIEFGSAETLANSLPVLRHQEAA